MAIAPCREAGGFPLIHRFINPISLAAGLFLLLASFFLSNITLVGQDYRGVLRMASVCAGLALACLAVPLVRGPVYWRFASAALILLTFLEVYAFFPRMLR
ncbi:MAG: hypothetical protein JWN51_1509 [Phycisphaerales bacterium]|nr:hypothetical protein [Phycisphaerales bacterium]